MARKAAPSRPADLDSPPLSPRGTRVNGDTEPRDTAERTPARPTADPAAIVTPIAVDSVPDLADVLPALAERCRAIADEVARLEAEKKELHAQIGPLMDAAGVRSVVGYGWHVIKATGSNSSISAELLLANGVDMTVIEKSTRKKTYSYIQVRKPNEK